MHADKSKTDVWVLIDREARRDRRLRRVSAVAWSATFIVLIGFAAIIAGRVATTMRQVEVGMAPARAVWEAVMPLVAVVGTVSLLIAVLSTVGIFLRLRTASLHEIQIRLSALESMLTEQQAATRR